MINTLDNFIQETLDNNFRLIQINTDANGYPKELGSYGAIEFNTFKDAEDFCAKNGGETCQFMTRQGHTFWRKIGESLQAFDYTYYLDKCNDNVNYTTLSEETERFFEQLKDVIEDKDFEELENRINKHKICLNFFDKLKDDEVAIYNGNSDSLESCKHEFMQFSEDVYTYSIGVYFNPQFHTK